MEINNEAYSKPKIIGKNEVMLAFPAVALGAFLAGIIFGYVTYVIENTTGPRMDVNVLKGSL